MTKGKALFSKFPLQGRCPNGKELMMGAEISLTFAGGGPFLVRKAGKLVGGALFDIINTLGTKYDFMPKQTPAKGVNKVISAVSQALFSLKHANKSYLKRFFICRFPGGIFKSAW